MSLSLTAGTSRLDEDGAAETSTTDSLSLSLSTARPLGELSFGLGAVDTSDGTRTEATVSRSFESAQGSFSLSLGIEHSAFGETGGLARLSWAQQRPNGSWVVAASHALEQDGRDRENLRTRLSVDLEEALQPRLTGTFGLSYVDSEETRSGVNSSAASVSAGVTYALTQDWGLSARATHQIEEEDGLEKVDNTLFSLSIRRTFEFRP
jgi:outer membrane usher protein FimD/PapC